jgi:hypothetical protein
MPTKAGTSERVRIPGCARTDTPPHQPMLQADSRGESRPVKAVGDDSPRDGSPSDGATRRTRDRATASGADGPARGRGVDNVTSSSRGAEVAGAERMTSDEPAAVETVSKPHSNG